MDFIDVTIRESVYLKHGMTEAKALIYLQKYMELMPFDEVKYLELCFLDNKEKGTLLYNEEFIDRAYNIVKDKYGLTAVIHPNLVDLERWNPETIKKFSIVRFMINGPMDAHCEEIIDYLHSVGVAVSINVIYISRKNRQFVKECLDISKKHKVEQFAFADSCGSCMPQEVVDWLKLVKDNCPEFKRNFHFHDHFKLALTNALACMDYVDLIDCSVRGYGKGGGNLNLELVLLSKRVIKGEIIDSTVVTKYAELLSFLAKDIFEEDCESTMEYYKNLIIGIYNLNLKDVDKLEKEAQNDYMSFFKLASEKGIQK